MLQAIGKQQTNSPSALQKELKKRGIDVSCRTVLRYLSHIPENAIENTIARTTNHELSITHRAFDAFCNMVIIKSYTENSLYVREVSKDYSRAHLRDLFWICRAINKTPNALRTKESVDWSARLCIEIKKGRFSRNLESVMTTMRSWYAFNGIAGSFLASKCITGERKGRGRRKIRLTKRERHRFLEVVKSKFDQDVVLRRKRGGIIGSIRFLSEPHLRKAMTCCIKFLYYTGTRRSAMLEAQWHDVKWGERITTVKVVGKGRHKLGRIVWEKQIGGDFLQEFREYWESLGGPQEGLIFPSQPNTLSAFFARCYEEAKISNKKWNRMPVHIWRHTACQELLEATGGNEKLVAQILGWKSIDTMRRHYGEASLKAIHKGLLGAMGEPVPVEEEKLFKF